MRKIVLFMIFIITIPCVTYPLRQYPVQGAVILSEQDIPPAELENIDAVLLAQKKKLNDLFGKGIPGKPEIRIASTLEDFMERHSDWRIGGFYERGRITLQPLEILKRKSSLNSILAHEYCHYYFENLYPDLPFYLNEGLSVYLSGAETGTVEPVIPENMEEWVNSSRNITGDWELLKRYLYSSRNFIADLLSRNVIKGLKELVEMNNSGLMNLYRDHYDLHSDKVRVLINPRGEKRIKIQFDGICRSLETGKRLGDTGTFLRTNYYTNRIEIDGPGNPGGRFFINDNEMLEADLTFNGGFSAGEFHYRNGLKVLQGKDRLLLVNIVPVEYYLYGVVASEMPSTNREALKAQAVMSRSLARYKMKQRKDEKYDLITLTSDQSYRGKDWETTGSISAVRETEGLVMTFQDKLIYPYYSSTCSGWTALSKDVWRTDLPYIKSVECRLNGTELCSISPHYPVWERAISADELSSILDIRPINRMEAVGTDPHGRIKSILVNGSSLSFDEFKAKIARKKGWNFLKSNRVIIKRSPDGSSYEITGWGLGHGVGLCQYGAVKLAEKKDFRQIIGFYFQDVQVGTDRPDMQLFPIE